MKRVEFNYIYELADQMVDCAEEVDTIAVYGKYDVVKQLLECLIVNDFHISYSIELEDYEANFYDREFVLLLNADGICVEKIWHDTNKFHKAGYLDTIADIAFVHEDCNSRLLKHIEESSFLEFSINEDLDESDDDFTCCNECNECNECSECDKGENTDFKVTIKCDLDADEALKTIEELERRMNRLFNMMDSFGSFR